MGEFLAESSPLNFDADTQMVHCPSYVDRFQRGALTENETRRIGIPWSNLLLQRVSHVTGATMQATREILRADVDHVCKIAVVGGGAHHAHYDFGSGYCVLNDLVMSAHALVQAEKRVMIIDLDVHQGDGTSAILSRLNHDNVFVVDVHGASNFPFRKFSYKNQLDVPLPDRTRDLEYLRAVRTALDMAMKRFGDFDVVLYQAGVDPLEIDRLGRLSLSVQGLKERDSMVLTEFAQGKPVISMCGGGYAQENEESLKVIVQAHVSQIISLMDST